MDIFHKFFQLLRHEKLYEAPIVRPNPRVMDLGAGTGIWAFAVAEEYVPILKWFWAKLILEQHFMRHSRSHGCRP